MFFSEYSYHPHLAENGGFQIRSSGWRFLKTEIYHIHVDGRKRKFSNTMTLFLGSRLALPHIRFENAACVRRFFLTRIKKLRFRKYLATYGLSDTIRTRYIWTQIFFKLKKLVYVLLCCVGATHAETNEVAACLFHTPYALLVFHHQVFFFAVAFQH